MKGLRTIVHRGGLLLLAEQVLGAQPAFGWCHTHDGLRTVRWDGNHLESANGPLDLERTWSARIGGLGRELRWIRTEDGGEATEVCLNDDRQPGDTPVAETIDQQRITWGTVAATNGGWAELQETRTASVHLPAPDGVQIGDRLAIATREIVTETAAVYGDGVTDAGNRVVIDELLEAVVRVQDQGDN